MLGMPTAIEELALVLFTTLAPSGTIAFIIMGAASFSRNLSVDQRNGVSRSLGIPILFALVGLIASAAHLGNPSNALYVFMSVGTSPLSNEVLCAVVFLGLASIYWLYSFARHPLRLLQYILMVLAMLSGVAFITSIAFAYDVETIITWDTVYSPLNIWLNAFVGGPILAFLGFQAARFFENRRRVGTTLLCISSVALCANLVSYGLQTADLSGISNSLVTVGDLVPFRVPSIVLFGILCAAGILFGAIVLCRHYADKTSRERRLALLFSSLGCLLILLGIFVMRFSFYMMHMTVGLSV